MVVGGGVLLWRWKEMLGGGGWMGSRWEGRRRKVSVSLLEPN